jgi:hypothetical protein
MSASQVGIPATFEVARALNLLSCSTSFFGGNEQHGPYQSPGLLGLPRPGLEQVNSASNFNSRLYSLYADIVSSLDVNREFADKVETSDLMQSPPIAETVSRFKLIDRKVTHLRARAASDERLKALNGRLVSTGSGGHAFDFERLLVWYVWCANEYGLEKADACLEVWLDADDVEVTNTLWVYGIEVDDEIKLDDGYAITPAKMTPDSSHKNWHSSLRWVTSVI